MNLAYHRQRAAAKLRDTCTIESPASVISDGKGGKQHTDPQTHTYPCLFRAANGSSERSSERELLKGSYRARLPVTANAALGWIFRYGGQSFVIVWAPPLSEQATVRIIGLNPAT